MAYFAEKKYENAFVMFYSAASNLELKLMTWLDKAYFLIKACQAALTLLETKPPQPSAAPTAASASSAPPTDKEKQHDVKNYGQQKVALLGDAGSVTLDIKFVEEKYQHAKDLLSQYQKYYPDNKRIPFIQVLIIKVGQTLQLKNPTAVNSAPSFVPR